MPARSARLAALLALIALLVVAFPASTSAAADTDPPLRVPYTFLPTAVIAGYPFGADAPGTNDWSCQPTAEHPDPVILTHGLGGNKATNWQTYGPLLANEGYCVYALTYGDSDLAPPKFQKVLGGFAPIESSAEELKVFVAKVLASTGAAKVDIVGHSEGTLMPNYYAKFLGGSAYIDDYVSLAPLWHGTNLLGLATLSTRGTPFGLTPTIFRVTEQYFASGSQMLTGSEFMTKMRSGGGPAVPGITYTNIVTKYDELVQPYTSGIEPGMTNFVVQDVCKLDLGEHFAIAADPIAAQLVLNALDPSAAKQPRGRPVLPFLGALA